MFSFFAVTEFEDDSPGFDVNNNNENSNTSDDDNSDKCMVEVKIKEERMSPETCESADLDSPDTVQKKRSIRETSDGEDEDSLENSPKAPRNLSPVRDIATFKMSLELLQRIFPQQRRGILELILRASDEDVVKSIESLLPETNPRIFGGPFGLRGLSSQQPNLPLIQCDGRAKSAFSPIAKNHLFFKPGTYPAHAPYPHPSPESPTARAPSAFQTVEGCSPELSPSMKERFCYPVGGYLPYNRPASAALLSLTTQQQNTAHRFCVQCGFTVKSGDKFCCECGKSLG